jgi:chemotaxis regulatin CheY-phosphate phosphatase CheZ
MDEMMIEPTNTGAAENVILALQKVITLLDKIKSTIEQSSGKIPKASVQLNTVTQATEMATVEILNVLETISYKIARTESRLLDLRNLAPSSQAQLITDDIGCLLEEVKDDTMNITMAMQVQDITAQKIAAANHLIESVRLELLHELDYFESTNSRDERSEEVVGVPKNQRPLQESFDKNASFQKSARDQENIDRVVSEWKDRNAAKS